MADSSNDSTTTLKRKRSSSEDSEDRTKKKGKIFDDLLRHTEQLDRSLKLLQDVPGIDSFSLGGAQIAVEDILRGRYTAPIRELLSLRLEIPKWPEGLSEKSIDKYELDIRTTNDRLSTVLELFNPVLDEFLAGPSPSEYARPSVWPQWQEREEAILCLRPPDKQGLPLSILHDVFRRFQLQAKEPLPQTEEGAPFLEAAFRLCSAMGDDFEDETQRSVAFDECVGPLFTWSLVELRGERVACITEEGVVTVLREDKIELGDGHDAYMQASWAYQIHVSSLGDKKSPQLDHGAPTFLLTIQDPMFLVSGGFYDGKSTIVEPLTHPCIMLYDYLYGRQKDLARQLYALKQGIIDISRLRLQDRPDPPFAPETPRIYRPFTSILEDKEESLQFITPPRFNRHKYLFPAKLVDDNREALVKLVYGDYGEEVQQVLANNGLAPILYGTKRIDGAPTAIVMEDLQPLSLYHGAPGWLTLYDFGKRHKAREHGESIRKALNNVLDVLQENKMVHGDLRSNNIMVKVESNGVPCMEDGENVCLKVIDFDWSGMSGAVNYPMRRNETIPWPADRFEPIVMDHDRIQVRRTLKDVF